MKRRWPTTLATALALGGLAGTMWPAPAGAAEPAPAAGRVTALPGGCLTRLPDEQEWRSFKLDKPQVREGQRIRCQQSGTLKLELPGSGYETRFLLEPGVEYVVPLGQRLPATNLRPAARIAGVDDELWLLPEPGQLSPTEGPTAPHRFAAMPGAGEGTGALGMLGALASVMAFESFISQGASPRRGALALETCDAPLGIVVITAEPAAASPQMQAELASLARRSNCFVVADVQGFSSSALVSRELGSSKSRLGNPGFVGQDGPPVDFVLTPDLFPSRPRQQAATAASAAEPSPGTSAVATLKLVEARSGQQVAAAVGDSRRATATYLAALRPASSVPPPEPALSVSEETARQLALLDAYNRTVRTLRQQQAAARPATALPRPGQAQPAPAQAKPASDSSGAGTGRAPPLR